MAHKTKATPKDRQCGNTKPGQFNRCPAGGQNQDYENQPFGSMPRLSNSLRSIRFIHPERLSSPSSFIAMFSLSKRSASKRSCTANLSFLLLSFVDIVNLKMNNELKVTMYTSVTIKTTPRSDATLPRRLTTTDNTVSR